jgi:hypothetical protein
MPSTISSARLFRGRTIKIHSVNRVEVMLDLDFDTLRNKTFALPELEFDAAELSEDALSRAQHCLVVLLGGKRVLVEPPIALRDQWGARVDLSARIYLLGRVHGRPIGYTVGLPEHPDPALEVSPFYNWIASRGFDVADVKAVLNGGRGPRG